jgi:hypothetical protein
LAQAHYDRLPGAYLAGKAMIALKKGRRVSGNQMLASISTWRQARILQRIKRVSGVRQS